MNYTDLALLQKAVKEARDLVPYLEPLNRDLQEQKMRLLTLLDTALDKGEPPLPQTTEELKAAVFAAIETGTIDQSCLESLRMFEGGLWRYLAANYPREQVLFFFTQVADARAWYDELYDLKKQKRLAAIYGPDVELGKHVVEYETPSGNRLWVQCTDLSSVLEFCHNLGWKVWVNGINR